MPRTIAILAVVAERVRGRAMSSLPLNVRSRRLLGLGQGWRPNLTSGQSFTVCCRHRFISRTNFRSASHGCGVFFVLTVSRLQCFLPLRCWLGIITDRSINIIWLLFCCWKDVWRFVSHPIFRSPFSFDLLFTNLPSAYSCFPPTCTYQPSAY